MSLFSRWILNYKSLSNSCGGRFSSFCNIKLQGSVSSRLSELLYKHLNWHVGVNTLSQRSKSIFSKKKLQIKKWVFPYFNIDFWVSQPGFSLHHWLYTSYRIVDSRFTVLLARSMFRRSISSYAIVTLFCLVKDVNSYQRMKIKFLCCK